MEGTGANDVPALVGDTDPDGDDLSIIEIPTLPAHGIVTITGGGSGLTYRPATRFHGSDSFTYRIADGHGGTDTATVGVTVVKDATAPVVSAPVQRLIRQTVGTGTVKARVAWAAADPGSGVASYAVQLSTNGAAFKTVALATPASTWVDLVLTTGRSYQVRVRAGDHEGNTSAYVAGSTFEARRYEDGSTTVTYGGSWGSSGRPKPSVARRISARPQAGPRPSVSPVRTSASSPLARPRAVMRRSGSTGCWCRRSICAAHRRCIASSSTPATSAHGRSTPSRSGSSGTAGSTWTGSSSFADRRARATPVSVGDLPCPGAGRALAWAT